MDDGVMWMNVYMNGWRRYVNECTGIYEWMTEVCEWMTELCEWMYRYIWMDDGGMWMTENGWKLILVD